MPEERSASQVETRIREESQISCRTRAGSTGDPLEDKTAWLLRRAADGDWGSREELRWLYRPKLVGIVAARLNPHRPPGPGARELADEVLERAFSGSMPCEYRGPASVWEFVRPLARTRILSLYRDERHPTSRTLQSLGVAHSAARATRGPLSREREREEFEQALAIAAGKRARKAVLLRMDLGLSYEEIASACRLRRPEKARWTVASALVEVVRLGQRRTVDPREQAELRELAARITDECGLGRRGTGMWSSGRHGLFALLESVRKIDWPRSCGKGRRRNSLLTQGMSHD